MGLRQWDRRVTDRGGRTGQYPILPVPIEDDFTTIRRYVEIADDKTTIESGELPLATGLEIEGPEFLMRDVPLHDDKCVVAYKGQASCAPIGTGASSRIILPSTSIS